MSIAITVFAWIGFVGAVALGLFTLFIWAVWVWERVFNSWSDSRGLRHAVSFYCGVAQALPRSDDKQMVAKLVFDRYRRMAFHEPEVAKHFKHLIETEVIDRCAYFCRECMDKEAEERRARVVAEEAEYFDE